MNIYIVVMSNNEIEEAEDAIYNQDLTDMTDLLVSLVKEQKEEESGAAKQQ